MDDSVTYGMQKIIDLALFGLIVGAFVWQHIRYIRATTPEERAAERAKGKDDDRLGDW